MASVVVFIVLTFSVFLYTFKKKILTWPHKSLQMVEFLNRFPYNLSILFD